MNIVLNQLRPIVQSQDRVGKFVKQLLVDAVHQNGEHQAGGAHPAIVPAIQEALEQSVLLLAQGRLGGFPFWHCHFRGWIRFAFHGFLFHNQLILGHGSIPADFGQLGIVNADLLILGGLFLRQKPTGLFLYELQNPFGIQHPFDRVPVGIAFPHHRIYGLDQSNQLVCGHLGLAEAYALVVQVLGDIGQDPVCGSLGLNLLCGSVEQLGLLKMDLLGLRNLTVIHDAVEMIRANRGVTIDIDRIPSVDEKTCEMLCAGDTTGVFQSESSGFTNLLMKLHPDRFEDLIPMVALYRPGPLGSGMAEDFIKRKHGEIPIEYPHPSLAPILKETYGVILYQEQVMQIASVMGGFSLGQSDMLRRAMGHKEPEILQKNRDTFVTGAVKNGVDEKTANYVFDLMVHFAGYGFNKSHSVCYGWIAWQTAYLKAHYRAEFMAAMMTCYNGDKNKVSRYISDTRRAGVEIAAPDVNLSEAYFSVSGNKILFGLDAIQNVGENAVEAIIKARKKGGPFTSMSDFLERVEGKGLNSRACESLIRCGAMDGFGYNRSQLLAALPQVMSDVAAAKSDRESGQMSLFGGDEMKSSVVYPDLEDMDADEKIDWERKLLGFYVSGHPLEKYKKQMAACTPIYQLETEGSRYDGKTVTLGGTVTRVKGMVTKKGAPMGYVTIEDYESEIESVLFPSVWEAARPFLTEDAPICIRGRVQSNEREVKILVDSIIPMAQFQKTVRMPVDEVHLYVDPRHETDKVSAALARVLAKYHGGTPVILHLISSRQEIRMVPKFYVDFSEEAEEALKGLLGNAAVEGRKN